MKKKSDDALWVIDGSHYLFRSYFAISGLAAPDGMPTNAIFGFIRMILYLIDHHQMKNAMITWDTAEPSWRKEAYEAYKAHREEMPDDLAEQIPYVKEMMDHMGIAQFEKGGYEADDIMYTAMETYKEKYPQVILVTNDKDLYQLIASPEVIGFHPALKVFVDEKFVEKKFGVRPDQMRDYLTLLGDTSDGVPGVPGVGAKTAAALLGAHGDLKTILKYKKEIKVRAPSKVFLEKNEKDVWESYKLIGLKKVPKILSKNRTYDINRKWKEDVFKLCERLGFTAISNDLKRIAGDMPTSKGTKSESQQENKSSYQSISVTPEGDIQIQKGNKPKIISNKLFMADLKKSKASQYLIYDLKRILHKQPDFRPYAYAFEDVMLLEYLSDPAGFKYDELRVENITNESWDTSYATIKEKPLYKEVEFPLIPVLYEMEKRGICIDPKQVLGLKKDWTTKLDKIAKGIYKDAGSEFNISSPKQLGTILYDKCGLPVLKKKKTGPSTDASVLTELRHAHPIVEKVLEYRELAKLVNTYTDALLVHADKKNVLHTELLQHGTASGRLSSKNPNLQNIPMRSDYATALRACFKPHKGYAFLSADYSQIELRILVHYCQCESLKQTFLKGEDIHTATAQQIFGANAGKDPKKRTFAKAINFGILYGQTPYGLSKMLGIEIQDAKDTIEKYYKKYPEIKAFQEEVTQKLTQTGQVETFMGRIRKFTPEELEPKSRRYQHALRAAFNTVLQGSASDIIKMAMLKVHDSIKQFKGYHVMQIHDELIFEVPPKMCKAAEKQIKQDMESVVDWEVPLTVEIKHNKF
jgi:DNA polymerase I